MSAPHVPGEPPLDPTRVMPRVGGPGAPPSARAPEPRGRRGRGRPVRRRGRAGTALRFLLLLLLLVLVALLVVAALAWARIDKVAAVPDDPGSAASAGKVYLLVGSDSREDLTPEERRELGTGSTEGRRTDTIMLLHLPLDRGRPALISVPRDSLVDIPGVGEDRINAAYAVGGAPLLVETLQENTGVAIDDYVEIGFGGFARVVDALGGVELCLDEAIADDRAHIDLPAGCQQLAGPDALGYARARYFDPRGDLGRVERQREVLGAIVDEAMSPATMLNPVRATRLALAGGDALTIDDGTGPLDLARFGWGMARVSTGRGDTLTVPVGEVANTVQWDDEAAGELWAALVDGREVPARLLEDDA
ncbi:MAG TPA: LCP family protein [Jiangellales bacterium]|nr:LCP family protein [Jiangellales bacterium]